MAIYSLSYFKTMLALLLVTLVCVVFSYYLQYGQGLEPCVMCLLQRYAMILLALVALVGLGLKRRVAKVLLLISGAVVSAAGLYVAVKQTYLQWYPLQYSSCGRDLYGLYEVLPFGEFFEAVLSGKADCATVDWSLFGLSLANYGVLFFTAYLLVMLYLLVRKVNS